MEISIYNGWRARRAQAKKCKFKLTCEDVSSNLRTTFTAEQESREHQFTLG
jgi:hypothetical protein